MSQRLSTLGQFTGVIIVSLALISIGVQARTTSQSDLESKAAICPELPKVTWWKTTRAKIVRYVDFKYKGNWTPYIQKWQNYKNKMQHILDTNGLALVKSRNIRLGGNKLAFHISEIDKRLEVTRCLESIFSGQITENKSHSSTFGEQIITVKIIYLSNNEAATISYYVCHSIINDLKVGMAVGCNGDGSVI